MTGYYAGVPGKTGSPFTTITFEASPLNRPLTQTAPGGSTGATLVYRTNTAADGVKLLSYDVASGQLTAGTYAANQLVVTATTDENSNTTTEYKDKEGRTVCKDVAGKRTYYGYDDLGQLRVVIPPKAAGLTGTFDAFGSNDLLFAYDYDNRGRLTRKKVPGAGITILEYNERDLLIGSTDAKDTKVVTSYDALNRPVSTAYADGTLLTQTSYDSYGTEPWPLPP